MKRTALELALSQSWAIQSEALEAVFEIAQRNGEDVEALSMRLGRPLDNTRTVTMRDGVAIIPVTGPIFPRANLFTEISGATSLEMLALDFQKALDSQAVKAIVLDISSPGGSTENLSEFAEHVFQARGEKPIVAYASSLAASAAIWIASAADEFVIGDTATVGSIGVVAGMRVGGEKGRIEIVSSQSPNKRVDPTTEEGRAQIQATVDDIADVFIETMARNRGVDVETVLSDFGRGGVLVGRKAVAAGMADRIDSLENVIAGFSGSQRRQHMPAATQTPEITRELIAKDFPDIAKAFREEGIESATVALGQDRDAAVTSAREEGAQAERARIQEVKEQSMPGCEELIETLMFDGTTTGPQAAVKVLAHVRAEQDSHRQALADDAPGALPTLPNADEAPKGFEALVKEKIAEGMTKGQATKAVAAEFPEAHAAFVAGLSSRAAA